MESIRLQKVSDAFHQAIANLLITQVNDPKLKGIRITGVKLTPDLNKARVYFDMPEGKLREREVLNALKHSKGFLKRGVADAINIKRLPDLEFFYDESGDLSRDVDSLFEKLEAEKNKAPTE